MTCDSDTGEAYSDNQYYVAEVYVFNHFIANLRRTNKSCIRQNLPLNIVSQPFKFFVGSI